MIDGSHLTLDQVLRVARENAETVISEKAIARTRNGRKALEQLLQEKKVIYGVNTGFGALSNFRIPTEDLKQLQTNLIRSHSTSVGRPHSSEVVRAMMLLRANTLLKGNSGIRPEVVSTIVKLLNKQIHPYIPEKGSVGASGDLSPLSHMALVLLGEGSAESRGRWIPGKRALEISGGVPLKLEAKEGLALNNGTQQMVAIGCLCLFDAYQLLATMEASLALSLEALKGWADAFDERIQKLRPHPGQQILEVEMNSATDNPLVFPEDGVCISGGNFHGQPVAMGLDIMALAISYLANMSERRISALLDTSLNNGLPPFLVGRRSKPGLSSGLMAVQYTATSLVAESKLLTHPASSDSIPTSSNFEDFVSMGPGAAHKARMILENSQYVASIELLVAAQGVDLRGAKGLGIGTRRVFQAIRRKVPRLIEDRSSHDDIEKIRKMVLDGEIAKIVAQVTGS